MSKDKIIIVIGANGYIGKKLVYRSLKNGFMTIAFSRKNNQRLSKNTGRLHLINYGNTYNKINILNKLKGLHLSNNKDIFFIHASGPAHSKNISKDEFKNGIEVSAVFFAKIAKTLNANFIYLSSIAARDYEKIQSHVKSYGKYKLYAENKINNIFSNSSKSLIILRLPSVWGKNAPGSFGLIEKIIKTKIPLPIMSIKNKRPYINIDFLVTKVFEIINIIQKTRKRKNYNFEISDGDYSLLEIIQKISHENNKRIRTFHFPEIIIKLFLIIICKKDLLYQIFNPLEIDNKKIKKFLSMVKE
tara:strand:- start:9 stop:914 length:906 start_codon:yes stop_codon:yes gene_type:complete